MGVSKAQGMYLGLYGRDKLSCIGCSFGCGNGIAMMKAVSEGYDSDQGDERIYLLLGSRIE